MIVTGSGVGVGVSVGEGERVAEQEVDVDAVSSSPTNPVEVEKVYKRVATNFIKRYGLHVVYFSVP